MIAVRHFIDRQRRRVRSLFDFPDVRPAGRSERFRGLRRLRLRRFFHDWLDHGDLHVELERTTALVVLDDGLAVELAAYGEFFVQRKGQRVAAVEQMGRWNDVASEGRLTDAALAREVIVAHVGQERDAAQFALLDIGLDEHRAVLALEVGRVLRGLERLGRLDHRATGAIGDVLGAGLARLHRAEQIGQVGNGRQQLFQRLDAVVVIDGVLHLLFIARVVEIGQPLMVLQLALNLLEQVGQQRVFAERLAIAHEQRVARGLAQLGAIEEHQHAAGDVLLVDGLRLEKLRIALRVRLAVYGCAQAGLQAIGVVLKFTVLLDRLVDVDLDRDRLAGFELDRNAGAALEAGFHAILAPRREPIPHRVPHDVGLIVAAALDEAQRQRGAQQELFDLPEQLAADVRQRGLEVVHLD